MSAGGSTVTPAAGIGPPGRRADAGTVRLGGRDIAGLLLCGEMYGAPYDLLAAFLGVRDRARGIVARWRKPDTRRRPDWGLAGVVLADPPRLIGDRPSLRRHAVRPGPAGGISAPCSPCGCLWKTAPPPAGPELAQLRAQQPEAD